MAPTARQAQSRGASRGSGHGAAKCGASAHRKGLPATFFECKSLTRAITRSASALAALLFPAAALSRSSAAAEAASAALISLVRFDDSAAFAAALHIRRLLLAGTPFSPWQPRGLVTQMPEQRPRVWSPVRAASSPAARVALARRSWGAAAVMQRHQTGLPYVPLLPCRGLGLLDLA